MPYTTVVAGTTITAAWSNANNRDQVITPFASASARDSAITSPVEGQHCYLTDTDKTLVYNGTVWVPATSNIIARQILTADSSAFTGAATTDFSIASVSARVERLYKVCLHSAWSMTNATDRFLGSLHANTTLVSRMFDTDTVGAGSFNVANCANLWLPATGTYTLDIRLTLGTGSGLFTLNATSDQPRSFWIEDIGPR